MSLLLPIGTPHSRRKQEARSFYLRCCFNNFPAGKKVMKYAGYPVVDLTVAGETLRFEQDNGSMHVGTSVWPSSLVLVKWVEHILLKGGAGGGGAGAGGSASSSVVCEDIQPRTFSGKRGVDLGTGCGVAGLGLALLGLNVVLTDIAPVMPALKRNFKKNVSSTSLASAGKPGSQAGKVKIAQLYWENEKQIAALKPPFDYVIAADVVYLENIVEPLLNAMSALAGPHTIILLGYQIRQAEAHELFWRLCPDFFHIQQIPHTELHPDYAWDENDIYILKKK
jgi:predicted nicotinamide N-methyase